MKPAIPDMCRSSFHNIKTLQQVIFNHKIGKYFTKPVELHFINIFTKLDTLIPFNKIERDWQLKRYKKNKPRVFKDLIFALTLISQKPVIA